jgi:hypothetical protein
MSFVAVPFTAKSNPGHQPGYDAVAGRANLAYLYADLGSIPPDASGFIN